MTAIDLLDATSFSRKFKVPRKTQLYDVLRKKSDPFPAAYR